MHAIVMVHKMQRMALSSHHLLPAAGAEKADSENTRNSENNDDEAKGEEDCQQGDQGFETKSITHKHWTEQKTEQDWETYTMQHTHKHTKDTKTQGWAGKHTRKKRHILHAFMYILCMDDDVQHIHSADAFSPDKKWHSLVKSFATTFSIHDSTELVFFSASIQRDSSQPTDEAAGSEQQ